MCTLPLSPENQRVQLQLIGIERPPTHCTSVDPGWNWFICQCMLVSSIPVPETVPALPSLLCDLQHLLCMSSQTPVSSHMETPPALTDKPPLLGFVPTQLHLAALWQSRDHQVCVCVSTPCHTKGDRAGDPNTAEPHCELCPVQEGQAHPQSQASSLRYTLNLDSSQEESSWAGGARQSPRVERKRGRWPCPHGQCSVCRGSVLMPCVPWLCSAGETELLLCGFFWRRETAARWAGSSPEGQRTAPPSCSTRAAHTPGSVGWEMLASAGGYPEVLRGSHGHLGQLPLCAEGCPSTVCSQCPLGGSMDIRCTEQAECSAASPMIEVSCGALPCPCHCLRGLCGLAWHLTSSAVCSEVSAAVAPGDGTPLPLSLVPVQ